MFEYENDIYTLEDLQLGAQDQGIDFETYLIGMKALGMVEKKSELPKVTKEDIKVTESKAIKRLRNRFDGLGFTFEESFGPGDRIKAISPPDENGIVTEKWFSFDKGILGGDIGISTLFGTSTEEEAKRFNEFIQTHYRKGEISEGVDANIYAATIKNAYKLDNALPEGKKPKNASSEELLEYQTQAFWSMFTREGVFKSAIEEIRPDLDAYERKQIKLVSEKYDLTTKVGVDKANEELEKLLRKKSNELMNESSEYQKIIRSINAGVTSRYGSKDKSGSLINKALVLEAEEEILPTTAKVRKFERAVYGGDIIADTFMHGPGVAWLQWKKGYVEAGVTGVTTNEMVIQSRKQQLKELKQKVKDGASLTDEHKEYAGAGAGLGFGGAAPVSYESTKTYDGTIGERITQLEQLIQKENNLLSENLAKSLEYQRKLSALDPAEIFDDESGGLFNPQLTTDEFQKMVGTQVLQMVGGMFVYPTFIQEAGGITMETLEIEAARKLFPDLEDKEAVHAFHMIDDDKLKTKIMSQLINNGEVNLGPAIVGGAAAASIDIASNFIVIGKALKFAPTSLYRNIMRDGVLKVLTSKGARGLYGVTGIETLTEVIQEEIAIQSKKYATGYGGDFESNIKRRMEAGGQAFLTTPFLVGSGQVTRTGIKEFRARVLKGNRYQARQLINKQKDIVQQSYDEGHIDLDERDRIFDDLEATEDIINNVDKYKKMDSDSKETTIKNLIEIKNLTRQKSQLETDNKKIQKENPGAPSFLTLDNKNKIKEIDKKLGEHQIEIINELLVSNYFQDGRVAEYINITEEGKFKGKYFARFDNKEQAKEYFDRLFDNKNWLNDAQSILDKIEEFKNKGLNIKDATHNAFIHFARDLGDAKKLQSMLNMKRLYDGDVNAGLVDNTAWVIDENIVHNIRRKGDRSSTNAFHHEGLHWIQANMDPKKLAEIKLAIEKELISTNDTKLLALAILSQKWFSKRYAHIDVEKDPKTYYQEWFSNLSDAMKYLQVIDLNENNSETLFNIGKIFGGMFGKQTQLGLDWSKFDAGNALEYMQKWNNFRGVSSDLTLRMPRGHVNTEQEDRKEEGKLMASEVYKEINDTFNEYVDIDRELAANVTAEMMQGIVFDRLIKLKDAGLIEGFKDKDLEEIQLQFTGPRKDLPKKIRNRGAVGLLMKFEEDFKGGVMGYFNAEKFVGGEKRKVLDMRLQEFVENHPKYGTIQVSMEEEGVTKAIEAQETVLSPEEIMIKKEEKKKTSSKPRKKEDVMLHEELARRGFKGATAVHDYLVAEYTKLHEEGKLEGMSLKDLKKIGEAKIQELFGVIPKPGNLTKSDLRNSQMKVKKLGKDFFVNFVFGKHHTEGIALRDENGNVVFDKDDNVMIDPKSKELSTGLPAVLQSERPTQENGLIEVRDTFFENIKRGKNLKLKRQKKFDDDYFYEKYGVLSDDPNLYKKSTNISQLHRGTHTRVLQVMSSQAARQVKDLSAKTFDQLADGLAPPLFSESMRLMDDDSFMELFAALPEIGLRLKPFVNDYDKEHLRAAITVALPNWKGKKITLLDNRGEVNAITHVTNGLDKVLSRYASQVKRFKKINKVPVDINEFVLDELLHDDLILMKMVPVEIDGKKVNTIDGIFDDKNTIQHTRNTFPLIVESIINKHGAKKGIELVLKYVVPMYTGAGKIGNGKFNVDKSGNIYYIGDKAWEKMEVRYKELHEGAGVPVNRKKVFIDNEDIVINGIQKAFGGRTLKDGTPVLKIGLKPPSKDGKIGFDLNKIYYGEDKIEGLNTTLLSQSSGSIASKIKNLAKTVGQKKAESVIKAQSKKEAKDAMYFVHDMMEFYNDNDILDNAQMVIMLSGLNSDMKSPMRRAANLMYVVDGYDKVKNPGQNLEYEHMIPAQWMMLHHLEGIVNGSITKNNLQEIYKDYTVAIIPKKMDLVLKESGYNSAMPISYKLGDGSWKRYYNDRTLTKNNIFAIRELGTNKYVGKRHEGISKKINKDHVGIKALFKAVQKSRMMASESVGITVLDFDDTLATTKSLVRYTVPDGTTGTLNAEEYASQYQDLLTQGYEFDFTDFNKVVKAKLAPLFNKALKLQKKFGPENMFILTARPPAAQKAIFDFLKANGLNIPIKNITGLGNSTAEAKALWVAEKVGEGYNDFYFADDALQNVQAVKNMLGQFDVKSKIQQARRGRIKGEKTKSKKEKIKSELGDANNLGGPNDYNNIMFSEAHRAEYENTISKNRPDLVKEKLVSKTIDNMFVFIDGLNIPSNKKRKYEQITTKWLATSNIKLKEDAYKVEQAVEIAEKHKEDIFSYRNPNELIEKYAGKIKKKPLDPSKTKEFTFSGEHKKRGITVYEVQNTKEGQQAVRDIVNTHWGIDSNPWCITKAKKGKLTEDAWLDWTAYEKGPKRIIFHNGKLSSFYANRQYWDRMDNATDGPTIIIKKGRVTNKVELVPDGTGRGVVEEFIRETRTVSKDKKTVTKEIFADSQDGYAEGTKIVENKVNGITVKSTRYNPEGNVVEIKEFSKDGKAIASYNFFPDGKMSAVNTHGQPFGEMSREDVVMKKGDVLSHQVLKGGISYMYGKINLDAQGIARDRNTHPIAEIGWKVAEKNSDLKNVIKTVDGKVRLDLKKVLEIDPDTKGLPRKAAGGMRAIEPVKKVLDQLDVKSDVQQALASERLDVDINTIMEHSLGVESGKRFSKAEGKVRGKDIKRRRIIMPDSAADMELLIEPLLGKGKEGIASKKWFEKNFYKPWERGVNDLNTARQTILNDYMSLRKQNKDVTKQLDKAVEGTNFTVDQAMRVYIWNKNGFKIPDLVPTTEAKLIEHIKNNPKLQSYADRVATLTKIETGLKKPSAEWWAETLASEVSETGRTVDRQKYIADWIEAKNEIFSETNLNKMESRLGSRWRSDIEDMFNRMETGRTRGRDMGRIGNKVMNYLNGSVGAIMNLNTRSATLQLISSVNFINHAENNPFAAARAFANQPQYWKDFMRIMNSDMLLQRRAGLKINVTEAELAAAVDGKGSKAKRALAWILKQGYIPTKVADSFAIASGGATYLRNRIRMYEKQGLETKEAEKKAWIDFQSIAEKTQQSSRADLLSRQQTSFEGRLILPFSNTPMQMNRIMMKEMLDLSKGRYEGFFGENSFTNKMSKISYYGAIQSLIFAGLQSGLFALMANGGDDEMIAKKKIRTVNTMTDSFLRGMGIQGAVTAGLKNAILKFLEQNEKGYNADYTEVGEALLNISPTIGSKVSKMDGAGNTYNYNKKEILKKGFSLDNTKAIEASAQTIEAITNVPIHRVIRKTQNMQGALDKKNEDWQRLMMLLGWSKWDVGIIEKKKKKKKKKKRKVKYF